VVGSTAGPPNVAKGIVMSRLTGLALLAVAAIVLTPSAANATPHKKLVADLGALWTKVFATPSPQNPFGSGDALTGCWDIGGTVAPLGPNGVPACTIKTGTKLLVAGHTNECSSLEGNGTTVDVLAACAKAGDPFAPVTLDGKPLSLTEVQTSALPIVLGANNVFGLTAGTQGISVAHGWLALVHPLKPGSHTIVIKSTPAVTTVITVIAGHRERR
jgi:hypothetical protein